MRSDLSVADLASHYNGYVTPDKATPDGVSVDVTLTERGAVSHHSAAGFHIKGVVKGEVSAV
jgi:hypothetical protein